MKTKWKPIKVLVKNGSDPVAVALRYTKCLTCKNKLNFKWECTACKTYLTFVQENLK